MKNLSLGQLRSLSDFFNTMAVAWFTAGIISPFFFKPGNFTEFILLASIALGMTVTSLSLSLHLAKGVKI